MEIQKFLDKLNDDLVSYNRNPDTIKTYASIAKSFLVSLKKKKTFDDSDVASYLAILRKAGKSDNTIRYTHYTLRKLFTSNKLEFSRRPPPITKVNQPFFSKEEIGEIIRNAKVYCDMQEKAFLVMSTVYALRRSEISGPKFGITNVDIDRTKHYVFIKTEKYGTQRVQFIPENLRKYIYAYDWSDIVSKARMSVLFGIIIEKCKFKKEDLPKRTGWHSLRRGVCTCLMQMKVDPTAISKFFRWKSTQLGNGSPMIQIYNKTEDKIYDEIVFNSHPFLNLW